MGATALRCLVKHAERGRERRSDGHEDAAHGTRHRLGWPAADAGTGDAMPRQHCASGQQLPFLAWPGGQNPPPPPRCGSTTTAPSGVYTAQPASKDASTAKAQMIFMATTQE